MVQVFIGIEDRIPGVSVNVPPEWTSVPTPPLFVEGSPGETYSLLPHAFDADGDTLIFSDSGLGFTDLSFDSTDFDPDAFEFSEGLPDGVTISGSDLVVDAAAVAINTTAQVYVSDGINPAVLSGSFPIIISGDVAPAFNSTPPNPVFIGGVSDTYDFNDDITDDAASAITWSVSGTLDSGLTLNTSTGILTYDGIGAESTNSHTVTATDAVGSDTSVSFDIVIGPYLPVVPGLFSYGCNQAAGRGGTIYRINTLSGGSSGPTAVGDGTYYASFRTAVTRSEPRIIIFEKAGIIDLGTSHVVASNGNLTIAGQTAPSPGVMVRGGYLRINDCPNVLVQHMRFRSGDYSGYSDPDNADSVYVNGFNSQNIVFDHCTMAWAIDENASVWGSSKKFTFANCFVHEGFVANPLHSKSPTRVVNGLIIGNSQGQTMPSQYAVVRTLFTHNPDRNPFSRGTDAYIANNFVYGFNFDGQNHQGANDEAGTSNASIVNCYYKKSIESDDIKPITIDNLTSSSNLYIDGNDAAWLTDPDDWSELVDNNSSQSESTLRSYNADLTKPSGYQLLSTAATPAFVLANAGARPDDRDPPEDRNVADATATDSSFLGDGDLVSYLEQSSGPKGPVPDGWPTAHYASEPTISHTLPANPHDVNPVTGYTNIEDWLHTKSAGVEP